MPTSPGQIVAIVMQWLRWAAGIALLVLLTASLARHLGIVLPVRGVDHVTLAYLAGVYWLIKV